jgi:hypothetical protein
MNWHKLDTFVMIQSPWLTLIGEKWQDEQQKSIDYWRVEKADSVIIIPVYNHQFLLPKPMFRPGIGGITLDFPGGRLLANYSSISMVSLILKRELDIPETAIISIDPIHETPLIINSSFSNQKLHGFVANLDPQWELSSEKIGEVYQNNQEDIQQLLKRLTCLQCRSLLLEFWLKNSVI